MSFETETTTIRDQDQNRCKTAKTKTETETTKNSSLDGSRDLQPCSLHLRNANYVTTLLYVSVQPYTIELFQYDVISDDVITNNVKKYPKGKTQLISGKVLFKQVLVQLQVSKSLNFY